MSGDLRPIKVVRREAVFIPIKDMTPKVQDRLKEKLKFSFFAKEKVCEECEWFHERINDVCESCANYKGSYELASNVKIKNKKYLKVPVGSWKKTREFLERHHEVKVKSKHPDVPIKPFKFTGEFREGQKDAIRAMLKHKRGVLKAPPRTGKCVEGSTIIYTDSGLVRIDSLFKGLTLNPKGETEVSPSKPVKIQTSEGLKDVARLYTKVVDRTMKITTVTGKSIRGTENHPVRVAREGCELEWVPLSEVKVGDYVVSNTSKNAWHGKSTRLLEPSNGLHKYLKPGTSNLIWHDKLPTRLTVELAALMGMLIADGRLQNGNSLGFTNTDPKKIRKFRQLWKACFPEHILKDSKDQDRAFALGLCSKQIKLFFEKCCGFQQVLAGQKTIPKILLKAPREHMMAFIAGYASCDGEINPAGVCFSSASFKFARQLSTALTALGYRNSMSKAPFSVQLSHKTKGDRVGKYGACSMKRYVFDQLVKELPFLVRDLKPSETRSLDQDDEVPFLRSTLHKMSVERQCREGQHYFWRTDGKKLLAVKGSGTIITDKRGRGRTPHMNRAVTHRLESNTIAQTVNWSLLQRISGSEHRRLMKYSKLSFERIESVCTMNSPIRVYDVHVPGPENFFGNGILNHNTVMGTAVTAIIRQKTLILASQRDWLMGFKETYIGSDTQKPLTNLNPKRIKLCKTLKDFEDHDICLATVQTFYSPGGENLLRKIRDMFGVVLVDEVHTSAADKYAQIVAKINARYFIGFSGTPTRKDTKEVLMENIIGEVFYSMETKRQKPRVRLTRTGFSRSSGRGVTPWVRLVSQLENDKKRIKVIAQQAIKDVANGHMVLIPVAQVKPIKKIVDMINKLSGKTLAYAFTGSLKKELRDSYIQKARDYKIKILVGTQKILSVGINIPRASCLYETVMSSNLQNAEQRMARVLTPMDGKPQAVIRYFLDECSVRKNCMRNEYFRVLMPVFKPEISPKDKELLELYFKTKPNAKFEF
jgi:superfamily II DNA or RNA helicase